MRIIILAAAMLLPLATPALAQGIGEGIAVGDWVVRRVQDAGGGAQTCVAALPADDKSAVGFGATNQDKTFVMLIDPTAKWTPGKDYALEFKIDAGKTTKASAFASNPTTLIQVIGTIKEGGLFFDVVQAGNDIHLETADSTYDYALKGSKAALDTLGACLGAAMGG